MLGGLPHERSEITYSSTSTPPARRACHRARVKTSVPRQLSRRLLPDRDRPE
jgi:hypothetical protein